jgi:hypothetical protein
MTPITWAAVVLGGLVAVLLVLAIYGRHRWAAATQALLGQLEAADRSATRSPYHEQEIDGLPAPVQRYFRTVLRAGQPIVTGVTVQHTGTFNVTAFGNRETWMPFTSDQSVLTHRPGFVWSARMPLLPGIAIFVHDAYVAGVGTLHPALLGLFSLTHQHGTDDIARGELMRYMMEAVWYPTALLPSQGTTWVAIDEESANATMVDGDISMTMRFSFDATGLIDKVDAEARGALIGGKMVMMPWQGRLSNYQERAGIRVPLTGEAAWLAPGGRKPYWRGTIVSAAYEFAR